jgi:hypothetical protein
LVVVAWSFARVRLQQSSGDSCRFSSGQEFFVSQREPQGQSVTEIPCKPPKARTRRSVAAFIGPIIADATPRNQEIEERHGLRRSFGKRKSRGGSPGFS